MRSVDRLMRKLGWHTSPALSRNFIPVRGTGTRHLGFVPNADMASNSALD